MSTTAIPSLELIPYQYEPLPTATSVRLLKVLPRRLRNSEVTICGLPLITCLLETIDLAKVGDYSALSYTWGNPRVVPDIQYNATQVWPVNVNGRLLYVNKNLYEALQYLQGWIETNEELDQRQGRHNKTLLIEAAEAGHVAEVRRLILKGASLHCQDEFGETALHYAAENGHLEVVKLLLHYKANRSTLDLTNRTPLDCCLQRKRSQWMRVQELLTVPNSLDDADTEELSETRPIWIDAICIDQGNVTERNIQVAMMSQIYRSASKVVVWLGATDEYTDREAQTVACLSNQDEWEALEDTSREIIRRLLERHTWFQRKWVAQELAMAKVVEMRCGSYTFEWELLSRLTLLDLHYISPSPQALLPPARSLKYGRTGTLQTGAWVLAYLRSIMNAEARVGVQGELSHVCDITEEEHPEWHPDSKERTNDFCYEKPTLSQLVIMTWGLDATDPRDKIFALSSIASATKGLPLIAADYHKSIQEVFLEMGRIFVQAQEDAFFGTNNNRSFEHNPMGPLEGLSFVQPALCVRHHFEKGEQPCPAALDWPDLPTWVPNFDRKLVDMRFYDGRFNACGETMYRSYVSDSRLLRVDALFIDEVTMVEGLPPETTDEEEMHMRHEPYSVSSWLGMITAMEPTYVTGEDREEVLWRTLIANQLKPSLDRLDSYTEECPTRLTESFKYFVCNALSPKYAKSAVDEIVLDILDMLRETSQTSCLPSRSEIELYDRGDHEKKPEAQLFPNRLALYVHVRGLFITDRGYLGNGFNTVRPGDQVWLFAGARVPFVLRKVPGSDRFELIGEAYVHGLMNGEAATGDAVNQFHPIEIQ